MNSDIRRDPEDIYDDNHSVSNAAGRRFDDMSIQWWKIARWWRTLWSLAQADWFKEWAFALLNWSADVVSGAVKWWYDILALVRLAFVKADLAIEWTRILEKKTKYTVINSLKRYWRMYMLRSLLILWLVVGMASKNDKVQDVFDDFNSWVTNIFDDCESDIAKMNLPLDPIQEVDFTQLQNLWQSKVTWYLSLFLSGKNETTFDTISDIDFRDNLKVAWNQKMKNKPSSKKRAAWAFNTSTIQKLDETDAFYSYPLEQWVSDIDSIRNNIENEFDREKFQKVYRLNDEQLESLRKSFHKVSWKDLLAFVLTELCGDLPGKFSVEYLRLLSEKWWLEFIMYLPAIYDNYASFWPYQNTSFVVQQWKWSASILSEQFLPKEHRIPWSMIYLTPQDQHKATLLNILFNYNLLIRKLSWKKLDTYDRLLDNQRNDCMQYISTAHHTPTHWLRAAERRINNWWRQDFAVSCWNRILTYANRTNKFQTALEDYDF